MVFPKSLEQKVPQVAILTGPSGTGKSSLSMQWAVQWAIALGTQSGQIEIVNADSLLVYRGMDIGTAKPSLADRQRVPHHIIDVRDPNQPFTAGEFKRAAELSIEAIHARGNRALVVGGTGFYLKSLLFGLWDVPPSEPALRKELETLSTDHLYQLVLKQDPPSATRIGKSDRYRLIRAVEILKMTGKTPTQLESGIQKHPDPRYALWIIDRCQDELPPRIRERTRAMLDQGLISEFEQVALQFPESRALSSVGYAQVRNYLAGQSPAGRKIRPGLDGLRDEIELATSQLIKRQRTWFRNLKLQTPGCNSYLLDQDRSKLEVAFKTLYHSKIRIRGHLSDE